MKNTQLCKSFKRNMIKRCYPGNPGNPIPTIIQRVLPKLSSTTAVVLYNPQITRNLLYFNSVSYCKPFKFNNPYEYQHHDNILLCKDGSIISYKPSSETFWDVINRNLTNTIKIAKTSLNTVLLPKQEKKIYSGLINLPPEYFTKGPQFKNEFDKVGILLYLKTLYVFGKYKITHDIALFENIDKIFPSISELYEGMQYYHKWTDISMVLLQHILRTFFLDKKFPIELFDKYMEGDVDFSQYKEGDILLLIECFVAKNTLKDLIKRFSITAVNHEIPEEQRAGYSKQICKEMTGQENADFLGTQCLFMNNMEIILINHYKDVKTYESGALKGRLSMCPNLYSNIQEIREYITKYYTAIKTYLDKNHIKDPQHPIYKLYIKLETQKKSILNQISLMLYNKKYYTILEQKDRLEIKKILDNFQRLLRETMADPQISDKINLGISMDPGIADDFIDFVKRKLQINFEQIVANKQMEYDLFNIFFDKNAHREMLRKLAENLSPEMQSTVRKAIEYFDIPS